MLKIVYLFGRIIDKIKREYRNRLFYERTGQRAKIVGDIVLINRNLKIGKNVTIYPYVQIFGDGLIEIGDNVSIGTGTILYASNLPEGGIKIGDNTLIGGQCYIIDADHGTKKADVIQNQQNNVEKIVIEKDCWIGANVTVLKGSVIHDGAVIGAKALVKGEIPEYSICVGIPAKMVRERE